MTTKMLAALTACATICVLAAAAPAAPVPDRAPRPFALVFDGGQEPGVGQENPRRTGAFSGVAPVCASGVASDDRFVYPDAVLREHACADGSGTFTAVVDPRLAEHGGVGIWRIVGGTGRFTKLRGSGTFTGELVSGSPSREETIGFRTTWRGVVGFDDIAPSIRSVRASARRLGKDGLYRLRVSFSARDDVPGNVVRYSVLPTSGSYALPFAEGRTRGGAVRSVLDVLPRRPDLPVVIEIRAADPLGNERRLVRSMPFD